MRSGTDADAEQRAPEYAWVGGAQPLLRRDINAWGQGGMPALALPGAEQHG